MRMLETIGKGVVFLIVFMAIFLLSFSILLSLGLVPETLKSETPIVEAPGKRVVVSEAEEPVRIVARDINLDAPIVRPKSKSIQILDKALQSGAVQYPDTASLGIDGTMLLFGHSSRLPLVQNRFYKTFNDIEKLEQGAIISVFSKGREYRYKVTRIDKANATADAVTLEDNGRFLKLITCNSFGSKEDRFIVTASFIGAYESD